jgi:hypothetical protein
MGSIKLDESGCVTLHGRPHEIDPDRLKALLKRAPEFYAGMGELGQLIGDVNDEGWQKDATEALTRLLSGVLDELFQGCCPTCRAVLKATFEAAMPERVGRVSS